MKPWVVDFDDFHDGNAELDRLFMLRGRYQAAAAGGFRATLFAPVGLLSDGLGRGIRATVPFLDLVPHGYLHETPRECEDWTYDESCTYLDAIPDYFTHGFKAPGWQISDGMYRALLERGWWVADQTYNDHRRPPELRAYLIDEPRKRHHHIQNDCGNGLEESLDELMGLDPKRGFAFVRDEV